MAFEENTYDHLEELGGSDFEMVDGEPNIIGWDVKNGKGQKIGEVDDLLFNPQSRKVKYMVVDMDSNKLQLDKGRKVLIPIDIADLHSKHADKSSVVQHMEHKVYDPAFDGNVVILRRVSIAQLNALPLYEKNHLSPQTEMAIRNIFEKKGGGGSSSDVHEDLERETG